MAQLGGTGNDPTVTTDASNVQSKDSERQKDLTTMTIDTWLVDIGYSKYKNEFACFENAIDILQLEKDQFQSQLLLKDCRIEKVTSKAYIDLSKAYDQVKEAKDDKAAEEEAKRQAPKQGQAPVYSKLKEAKDERVGIPFCNHLVMAACFKAFDDVADKPQVIRPLQKKLEAASYMDDVIAIIDAMKPLEGNEVNNLIVTELKGIRKNWTLNRELRCCRISQAVDDVSSSHTLASIENQIFKSFDDFKSCLEKNEARAIKLKGGRGSEISTKADYESIDCEKEYRYVAKDEARSRDSSDDRQPHKELPKTDAPLANDKRGIIICSIMVGIVGLMLFGKQNGTFYFLIILVYDAFTSIVCAIFSIWWVGFIVFGVGVILHFLIYWAKNKAVNFFQQYSASGRSQAAQTNLTKPRTYLTHKHEKKLKKLSFVAATVLMLAVMCVLLMIFGIDDILLYIVWICLLFCCFIYLFIGFFFFYLLRQTPTTKKKIMDIDGQKLKFYNSSNEQGLAMTVNAGVTRNEKVDSVSSDGGVSSLIA